MCWIRWHILDALEHTEDRDIDTADVERVFSAEETSTDSLRGATVLTMRGWNMPRKLVLAISLLATLQVGLTLAVANAQVGGLALDAAASVPISDPFEPFNQAMFSFNLKLDEYVLRPVATGYATVLPTGVRQRIGRFFDNINIAPRLGNKLLQMKPIGAGKELSRFLINTTIGGLGFFDVADSWLGLEASHADFGQTLAQYGMSSGPYLVLPFFGPSTVRDAVGFGVDGAMQPMNYFLPTFPELIAARGGWVAGSTINARSLNLELFESVDRISLDLYGAVQDGYLQQREQVIQEALQK